MAYGTPGQTRPLLFLLAGLVALAIPRETDASPAFAISGITSGVVRSAAPSAAAVVHMSPLRRRFCKPSLLERMSTPTDNDDGFPDDDLPSDYTTDDLSSGDRVTTVALMEEDDRIREDLKRELILLSSVTDRGMYASREEADIMVDIITQLEALNPTADPALNCVGEWDLCLSNVQAFRSSPFFLAIRSALGDSNRKIAENGFELHNRATSVSSIGRVRQTVKDAELVSEVDLIVGVIPGLPFRVKGTVVTVASLTASAPETWELEVGSTRVGGSNVPLLDAWLDDAMPEVNVGSLYESATGRVPISTLKTFYVDEGLRITRDCDDNFFVFVRA